MLDSLVRVSRRDKEKHFTIIFPYHQNFAYASTRDGFTLIGSIFGNTKISWRPHINKTTIHKNHGKINMYQLWFPSLPFQQFQVLFNSLFKVLCIFPSRYLFAIGLPPIFSLRWNLPPTLSCNPKQLDSLKLVLASWTQTITGVSPSMLHFSKGLCPGQLPTQLDHNSTHISV